MMTRLVVAVDGGQSSTVCVLGTTDGEILAVGHGGPANHVHQPGGPERLRRAIEESVREAQDAAGNPAHVAAVYLALTGGVQQGERIAREILDADVVLAEGDPPAALASGTFGGPGIGLIAGTGAVALAENARGERIARGGWGYLVGDEGSGYWIGMRGVQAAARALDGRGPATVLTERVLAFYGETDLRVVASRIYGFELERPEIAALAPVVLEAAGEGDQVAARIVDTAAEELVLLLEAVVRAADLADERERVIVAAGGVMRPGNRLWERLADLIARRIPGFRLIAPPFPPVIGAFVLALGLTGVSIDQAVVDRIHQSSATFPEIASKGHARVVTRAAIHP
jgi:N-acetylglucosamine kinase-like BadF-type ATPase